MDDLHRPPGDDDRQQLVARIRAAHEAGRIGEADRDIRLGNVGSAQSMAELDLMHRDLDQLEASLPSTSEGPAPSPTPVSVFDPASWPQSADGRRTYTVRSRPLVALIATVLVAFVVGVVSAIVIVVYRASNPAPTSPVRQLPAEPSQVRSSAGDSPPAGPTGPAYALTEPGIEDFLSAYRQRFGTSRVVDLVLYGDYAIVNVPAPRARQSGWLFRDGSGWTEFGGVRARFPGATEIDTRRLVVPALVRNIARARGTLNVEAPAQAYVVLRFIRPAEDRPSADIHVSNEFRESGYLATTLDGRVERAYPYTR